MKPVIMIDNYYQDIYITLGKAISELSNTNRELQIPTLLYKFNKCCESHAQCMDTINQFVDIVSKKEN